MQWLYNLHQTKLFKDFDAKKSNLEGMSKISLLVWLCIAIELPVDNKTHYHHNHNHHHHHELNPYNHNFQAEKNQKYSAKHTQLL